MYQGAEHCARVIPMERPIGNWTQGGRITMFYWVHFNTDDHLIFYTLQTPVINLKYGINGWEQMAGNRSPAGINTSYWRRNR